MSLLRPTKIHPTLPVMLLLPALSPLSLLLLVPSFQLVVPMGLFLLQLMIPPSSQRSQLISGALYLQTAPQVETKQMMILVLWTLKHSQVLLKQATLEVPQQVAHWTLHMIPTRKPVIRLQLPRLVET